MRAIIRKEIADALRNRWLIGYAIAMAVLGLLASWLGLRTSGALAFQMFGRTAATLTNLVLLLAPLVALIVGATTLAAERDRGTMGRLLALPLHPRELLLGKFTGLLIALSAATLLGFAPSAAVIGGMAGPASGLRFLLFPLVSILLIAATLAIGMIVSAVSDNGLKAMGTAVFLWFGLVLLYDLLLIGTLVVAAIPPPLLAALLVINPVDAARVLVILLLEPDLYALGPAGVALSSYLGEAGALAVLAASLLVWTLVSVTAASLLFGRKVTAGARSVVRPRRREDESDWNMEDNDEPALPEISTIRKENHS
jgi:Cu-processing system permease protein